MQVLIAIKY